MWYVEVNISDEYLRWEGLTKEQAEYIFEENAPGFVRMGPM